MGHLRRNRKIACAIHNADKDAQIVLATGSDMADDFPPIPGLEIVRLPAVIKNPNGTYASPDPNEPFESLLSARSQLLRAAALELNPDVLITDKEPLGLQGELEESLADLRQTRKILGLRDVLDAPAKLRVEWDERGVFEKLPGLYDEIWIYGPDWFYSPLDGLDLAPDTARSCRHMGFLGTPDAVTEQSKIISLPDEYILVTAGGGEDGDGLMRQVLIARESGTKIEVPLVLLVGPLMPEAARKEIELRAARLDNVTVLLFDADPSTLMAGAKASVAMCGYNTFCEVLETDKPVLFVPRETPRQEQLIRAQRAAEFGAASVIRTSEADDPTRLSESINAIARAARPSESSSRRFVFDGLDQIGGRISEILHQRNLAAAQ